MDIGKQISEAVEKVIASQVGLPVIRAAEDGVFQKEVWDSLGALDLDKGLVSEDRGGYGLGWTEIAPMLRSVGAASLPLPIGEQMIAKALLEQAGISAPQGLVSLSMRPRTAAVLRGGRVSGDVPAVLWGAAADYLLIECSSSDGSHLALLPVEALTATPCSSLSREPQVTFGAVDVSAVASAPVEAGQLRVLGALLRVLQICGALNRVLEMTVEYANLREQFGRPIGRFQAVQQLLAVLANEVAAVGAVSEMAVRSMDRGSALLPVAVAKARSSVAADRAAAIAHEVHAAIGVTEELGLHHLTRRLWQWRDDYGSEQFWYAELGERALAGKTDRFWSTLLAASGGAEMATV